jgi:hypothetical protein
MKTRHSQLLVALLLLVGWPVVAGAQSTQFSLGLGYQWVDVTGSKDMYRSQVNDDNGVILDDFNLTMTDAKNQDRWFDHLRIDASGFGGSPMGSFRLDAGLARAYRLQITYMRAKQFSALPALANPFFPDIVPGQHTLDRTLDSVDLNLEILPDHVITPLVGYSWTHRTGPGRTTVSVGQNEFQLNEHLDETVQEFRAGIGFNAGGFSGQVLEGWRDYDSTEGFSLFDGTGNNSQPVLGQDVTLSDYARTDHASGTTPMTMAHVAGMLGNWGRLVLDYTRANLDSDTYDDEALSGNLVSFDIYRFFSGGTETASAKTSGNDWRGEARLEAEVTDGFELSASYLERHRTLDGWDTITTLYTDTTTLSGGLPGDVTTLLNARTAMDRDEKMTEATASYSKLGPFTLWAGFAETKQDITVTPDAAQIVVPGGQGGTYNRTVKRFDGGLNLKVKTFKLVLDARHEDADRTVVRTDFDTRNRYRARATWNVAKIVRLLGTWERIEAKNPAVGVGYDGTVKHWGVNAEVTASQAVGFHLGYDDFKTDSTITIRQPQDFSLTDSVYTEDGRSYDGGILVHAGIFALDAGYSHVKNDTVYGMTLERTYARVDLDLTARLAAGVLYDHRNYDEKGYGIDNFKANRYGVILRWHE